jgi:CHASE2 domain-containing sensor protein
MRKRIFSLFEFSFPLATVFSPNKNPFRSKVFLRGILVGLVISILVTVLGWLGYFKPYENFVTDFLQDITAKTAGDVTLLFVTDREYREGFGDTSPLSRKRLALTVNMLVKLKARVIALDFDLSDPTPEDPLLM